MSEETQMTPRIIIFDENEILCSTLHRILVERGYEVFTFPDFSVCPLFHSEDHCEIPHGTCSDIIISDIYIPTVQGLKLIKERIAKGCGVKFRALMSTTWTDADWQYAQRIGCRLFSKPFDLKEMLKWLDDCANQIDTIRQLHAINRGAGASPTPL
jgi:DNA-binding NtrC family response regulator